MEDIAVVACGQRGGGDDRIVALHLCAPSHWRAEDKIGRSFADAHAPVPGMERSRQTGAARALMDAAVHRGPWVRFAWGITGDDRLNHHPDPPPGVDPGAWRGRAFDPNADPPFFVRAERQVLWGLPDVNAFVFAIRVYHRSGAVIRANPHQRALLTAALQSMNTDARRYKNLTDADVDGIVAWLHEQVPGL
jgi:hypothetical protein